MEAAGTGSGFNCDIFPLIHVSFPRTDNRWVDNRELFHDPCRRCDAKDSNIQLELSSSYLASVSLLRELLANSLRTCQRFRAVRVLPLRDLVREETARAIRKVALAKKADSVCVVHHLPRLNHGQSQCGRVDNHTVYTPLRPRKIQHTALHISAGIGYGIWFYLYYSPKISRR